MTLLEAVHALTSKRSSKALRLFDEGPSILEEGDPNTERSSKVKRDILALLTCYAAMLKERRMKAPRHHWILSFMQKVSGLDRSRQPPATNQLGSCLVRMKTPPPALRYITISYFLVIRPR